MPNYKLNFHAPLVFFDTETGGLNADDEIEWSIERKDYKEGAALKGTIQRLASPILEIGAVIVGPQDLKEKSQFHSLCGPEEGEDFDFFIKKCSSQALKINGFADRLDELREAPPTSEVLREFVEWLPNKGRRSDSFIPCGQNVRFDFEMMNAAFRRFGVNFQFRATPLELTTLSKLYFALPGTPVVANYKLTTVSAALGVSTKDAHTAVADVRATAQCMREIFEKFCS